MAKKISALFFIATAIAYAWRCLYMTDKVTVSIENNNIVFHIPNQKNFTTLSGILVSRKENDQNIFWDYDTDRAANYATIKLPTKIVMHQNPFPYQPETNFRKPITDGTYKVSILIYSWDDSAPQTWIPTGEQNIYFSFCIKINNNNKYHLC